MMGLRRNKDEQKAEIFIKNKMKQERLERHSYTRNKMLKKDTIKGTNKIYKKMVQKMDPLILFIKN